MYHTTGHSPPCEDPHTLLSIEPFVSELLSTRATSEQKKHVVEGVSKDMFTVCVCVCVRVCVCMCVCVRMSWISSRGRHWAKVVVEF